MKRGVHIFVALLTTITVIGPFDCFAAERSQQAMECCLKSKCAPSVKSCCENTAPDGSQFLPAKTADHGKVLVVLTDASPFAFVSVVSHEQFIETLKHPPPGGNVTACNLPLLI
jgi:hypothetical protein